jgi:hypothetical protein
MIGRRFDYERDHAALYQIYHEVGWLTRGQEQNTDTMLSAGRAWVADLDGQPECVMLTVPGWVRHLEADLPLCGVSGVATGRRGRQQGLAGRLVAEGIAADAADGAEIAALTMFDQGFYNKLGFGTGAYEHSVSVDPDQLQIGVRPRVPCRLSLDDWQEIHAARVAGRRPHGSVTIGAPAHTQASLRWMPNPFGLGYRDNADGSLSHLIWCGADQLGNGPYHVAFMVYHTQAQLVELLALLKTLGDQVSLVTLREPPGVQLQDLMARPFRRRRISEKTPHETIIRANAHWQMRLLNLPVAMARTRLPGSETVTFRLELHDPIARYLAEDAPWHGIGGSYVVTLGPESGARPAEAADGGLPTLTASVNAFTRLWLGVLPTAGLALTEEIAGEPGLLAALDRTLRLPAPHLDWDF